MSFDSLCKWSSGAVSAFQPLLRNQNAPPVPSPCGGRGSSPHFLPTSGGAEPFPSSRQWAASEGPLLSSPLVKGSPVPGKFSVQTGTKKKVTNNPRNKDTKVSCGHYHNQESHSGQGWVLCLSPLEEARKTFIMVENLGTD